MVEAKAIKPQAGQELVADKPVTAFLLLVFFAPVSTNAYDFLAVVINRDDIWKRNEVLILFVINPINALETFVDVHLKKIHHVVRIVRSVYAFNI